MKASWLAASLVFGLWRLVSADTVEPKADPLAELVQGDPALAEVVARPEYEVQVRYTQIDRDGSGDPGFRVFELGVDAARYFYPASTVKLPVAVLAVEKLRRLGVDGLTLDTPMLTEVAHGWQTAVQADPSSPNGLPSVGHYLRKIFLVSDNDAYNRLYEFVGPDEINRGLHSKGIEGVRIFHRLAVRRESWHGRHTNPVRFVDGERVIYRQAAQESGTDYSSPVPILRGNGFVSDGRQIDQPKDFAGLNAFPLEAQQEVLKALVFPKAVAPEARFAISPDDRRRLLRAMGERPRESESPVYDAGSYPDAYTKFLLFGGGTEPIPPHLRSIGKSGMAYGFLCDNGYVVDFENGVEFLLGAVIHVNANGVYNDNVYEYDTVGLPFLKRLGRAVYQYELTRKRAHRAELEELQNLFAE